MNAEHEEQRLVELELRYMRLERTVEELSDMIADQGRTITLLARELSNIRGGLKGEGGGQAGDLLSGSESSPADAERDRPPHY
jgi:uncharacterized coiled-coil protein SlyX